MLTPFIYLGNPLTKLSGCEEHQSLLLTGKKCSCLVCVTAENEPKNWTVAWVSVVCSFECKASPLKIFLFLLTCFVSFLKGDLRMWLNLAEGRISQIQAVLPFWTFSKTFAEGSVMLLSKYRTTVLCMENSESLAMCECSLLYRNDILRGSKTEQQPDYNYFSPKEYKIPFFPPHVS